MIASFAARTASGPRSQMIPAHRRAVGRTSAAGTTAFDQPDPVRFLGRAGLAHQDHLHRLGEGHHPRQALRPAGARHDGPANLREPEDGVLRRHPDVAAEHQLEPASERVTVHGRDDGLPDLHAAGDAAESRVVVAPSGPWFAERLWDHLLQIGAGGERLLAGSGQDRHPRLRVVAEPHPGVDQLPVRLGIDRVHGLGPVQRDRHDVVLLLVEKSHGSPRGWPGGHAPDATGVDEAARPPQHSPQQRG